MPKTAQKTHTNNAPEYHPPPGFLKKKKQIKINPPRDQLEHIQPNPLDHAPFFKLKKHPVSLKKINPPPQLKKCIFTWWPHHLKNGGGGGGGGG
ncbi:hypothetical protein ACVGXX_04400, partial [Enterobacter intestinihominis]